MTKPFVEFTNAEPGESLEHGSNTVTPLPISVCVPTYRRPQLLERALRSVGEQDYRGAIECVVSENGQDAHVGALLERMASTYPQVQWRLIQAEETIPAVSNWLRAFSSAQYEWLKVLWDDDWLEPNCLSELADCAVATGADVVTCGARVVSPAGTTRELYGDVPSESRQGAEEVLERLANLREPLPVSPAAALVRRSSCLEGLRLSAVLTGCFDRAMGPDLCLLYFAVFNGGTLAHTPAILVNFWAGEDSITITSDELSLRLCYDRSMILLAKTGNVPLPRNVRRRLQHRSFLAWAKRDDQRSQLLPPRPQAGRLAVNIWERRQALWVSARELIRRG